MGLDFSHGKAHWSYRGFHRFRIKLAASIGIELEQMDGFGGTKEWDRTDPLTILLDHSDCEDDIKAEDCEAVAKRLREEVSKWGDDFTYDKEHALLLAKGLEAAAKENKPLRFC